ncbi:MAG: imidazoleglycerol-phosphate dehydratase HisB [Deltaproteobacteria bacterium]|nr:imidazoleglycerol-phosphate dehydratase HisB [Deltaproteobacteria bacterium]
MARKAKRARKTSETDIVVEIELDGEGKQTISTSIPFLDHMLSLFSKHGLFDLKVKAKGDIEIDDHHTVEDVGICLGDAVRKALGSKKGIRRYGTTSVPMDETLASVTIDMSDRPYLVYNVTFPKRARIKSFDQDLVEDFLQAFSTRSGCNLHVNLSYGRNIHHIIEAIFKAFGRALSDAVRIDPRIKGVMSTKGKL